MNTSSLKRAITWSALGVGIFAAYSFSLLAVGMRSGIQDDRLFHLVRDIKRLFIPPQDTYRTTLPLREHFRTNEFGQLTWYHDKVETGRPEITDKTVIAFVFGQSNAANAGGEKHTSLKGKAYNYLDGRFYVASDPLLGATGISGSVLTNMANKLVDEHIADKVILISAAVTETTVMKWQKGRPLYAMLETRLQDVKQSSLEITHFLWHQGEADNNLDPQKYTEGLTDVIALAKRYFPHAAFFVAQASRCGMMDSSIKLLEAQRNITRLDNVFLGPNTDQVGLLDRYDDCHLSGRGLEKTSSYWVRALRAKDSLLSKGDNKRILSK